MKRPLAYVLALWLVALIVVFTGVALLLAWRRTEAPSSGYDRVGPPIAERTRQAFARLRDLKKNALDEAALAIFDRQSWFKNLAIDPKKGDTLLVRHARHRALRVQLPRNVEAFRIRNEQLREELAELKADYEKFQEKRAATLEQIKDQLRFAVEGNLGRRQFDPSEFGR